VNWRLSVAVSTFHEELACNLPSDSSLRSDPTRTGNAQLSTYSGVSGIDFGHNWCPLDCSLGTEISWPAGWSRGAEMLERRAWTATKVCDRLLRLPAYWLSASREDRSLQAFPDKTSSLAGSIRRCVPARAEGRGRTQSVRSGAPLPFFRRRVVLQGCAMRAGDGGDDWCW